MADTTSGEAVVMATRAETRTDESDASNASLQPDHVTDQRPLEPDGHVTIPSQSEPGKTDDLCVTSVHFDTAFNKVRPSVSTKVGDVLFLLMTIGLLHKI